MAFELAELGHAYASPASTIEHQSRWDALLHVLFGERTSIGKRGRKLGYFSCNLDRALVFRQPAERHQEVPLAAGQQSQNQKGDASRPRRSLPDRNHRTQSANGRENWQVPGHHQKLHPNKLGDVENKAEEQKSDSQPEPRPTVTASNRW